MFKEKNDDVKFVRQNYIDSRINTSGPLDPEGETISGFFDWNKFEIFFNQMQALKVLGKIDGIRICLFREKKGDLRLYTIVKPEDHLAYSKEGLSQVSFLLTPTNVTKNKLKKDDHSIHFEDDYVEDGFVYCMRPGGEVTGLCPPKCGK